uniref:Homeobox domain-containing protein n=1 Tax=Araucaria cunninghamii TaxID=56994 RepID=A0A0D6QT49_ARACU
MTEVLNLGVMEDKGFVEQKRRLKTPSQVEALENIYAEHKYPSESMKSKLSRELGLSEKQVQRWFRHRRLKDKKGNTKKEDLDSNEELDAGSGNNLQQQQQQQQVVRKDLGRLQNQRLLGVSDFPSAVLAAELTDRDMLKRGRDQEDFDEGDCRRTGNGSTSQDTSSSQSRSSYEMEALRNGNYVEIRGNNNKKLKEQGLHQTYPPQLLMMACEEQSGATVLRQCGGSNGSRQGGGSNFKQIKHRNHFKGEENMRFANNHDYPSAVLAAELTDKELLKGEHQNHDVAEDPYVSVSQEKSSLQSGSSYEMEGRRPTFKSGSPFDAWRRRGENEGLQIAADQIYWQQDAEHHAISAVKSQLGRLYKPDGPALNVEFDPLPSGAFGYR